MSDTLKKNPLVSVIVTTFNRKELLKETIDSILNQTYKNFELIVVDNNSNYNFFEFIADFNDERLSAYQNNNNGIIAVNRNFGIKKSKGEFIAFCDDDDTWKENKIEVQIKCFDDENIIGVASSASLFGEIKYINQKQSSEKLVMGFEDIYINPIIYLSSLIIYNKKIFFDESLEFRYVEDYELLLRLTLNTKKKILRLPDYLINYRLHNTNASSDLAKSEHVINILEKYKNEVTIKSKKIVYSKSYLTIAIKALKASSEKSEFYVIKAYKFGNLKQKIKLFPMLILIYLPELFKQYLLGKYYLYQNKKIK